MQAGFEEEDRRRVVLSFCPSCWKCTCFRGNAAVVKSTAFMDRLKIFESRTAIHTDLRLRKELEASEWADIIHDRLKWGVAPGPDKFSTDLVKTMTSPEKEVLRRWINEVLTTGQQVTAREVKAAIRNGTITLLHKEGDTTELTSDWRPVILLNTVSQLWITSWKRGCDASQRNLTSLSLVRQVTALDEAQISTCGKYSTLQMLPRKLGSRYSAVMSIFVTPSTACRRPRYGQS